MVLCSWLTCPQPAANTCTGMQGPQQNNVCEPQAWSLEYAVGLQRSEIREALRTIAGLYLRADVAGIRDVIEQYHLADILTRYLVSQYKQSATLAGLGLQLSKAFVVDAMSHKDSRSIRRGLDMVGDVSALKKAHFEQREDPLQPSNSHLSLASQDSSASPASTRHGSSAASQALVGNAINAAGAPASLSRQSAPAAAQQKPERRQHSLDLGSSKAQIGDSRACALRRFGTRTILQYLMQVRYYYCCVTLRHRRCSSGTDAPCNKTASAASALWRALWRLTSTALTFHPTTHYIGCGCLTRMLRSL